MKFLAALTFAVSLNALADSTIYDPKKMTCGELKDLLENYKVITVRTGGLFNLSYGPLYASNKDSICNPDIPGLRDYYWPWPVAAEFRTKDVKRCQVGFVCERREDPFRR